MHNGIDLGHGAWQIDRPSNGSMWNVQFPTCWPVNGLFVHWSRGWGVLSFFERHASFSFWKMDSCSSSPYISYIFATEYWMFLTHEVSMMAVDVLALYIIISSTTMLLITKDTEPLSWERLSNAFTLSVEKFKQMLNLSPKNKRSMTGVASMRVGLPFQT